jgi:hypothetical protein
LDVNWKALPADLMYDVLGLPYRIEQLQHFVSGKGEFDEPPEYVEFFWARQYGYAVLGLDVSELAQRLRTHAELPPPPHNPSAWDRGAQLREIRDRVTTEREAYERRIAERVANPFN